MVLKKLWPWSKLSQLAVMQEGLQTAALLNQSLFERNQALTIANQRLRRMVDNKTLVITDLRQRLNVQTTTIQSEQPRRVDRTTNWPGAAAHFSKRSK